MATETVYGTIASSTVPVSVSLTGYFQNITIQNLSSSQLIWARADGTAAASEADGSYAIQPGTTVELSNGEPYWTQAFSVIPAGTLVGGTPGTPAEIQPYGSSLAGGKANPGVHVSVILDTGTTSTNFVVSSAD